MSEEGAVPRQVLEAAKAADELHAKLYPKEGEAATAVKDQPPAGGETSSQDDEQAFPTQDTGAASTGEGAQDDDPAKVQQRYKVLQGMYNADTKRLREENERLRAQVEGKHQPAPSGEQPAKEEPKREVPKRLIDSYGEEFVDDLAEATKARGFVTYEEIKPLIEKVQAIEKTSVQSSQSSYISDLTKMVPNWKQIKSDPRFAKYLEEEDGNTGMTRMESARRWQDGKDAARVARYFKGFIESVGGGKPAATDDPLKRLTVPRTGSAAAILPGANEHIPIVKASEMMRLADDERRGVYRGREAELLAIKAKHNAAQSAGRVLRDV